MQVIPAHNDLTAEAVSNAADLDYAGQPVRVIRPEYLIAMYLEDAAAAAIRAAAAWTMSTPDVIEKLREGKRALHRERVAMSLEEKVRQVVELQKIHVAIVGRRHELGPLEKVWQLLP